MGPCVDFETGCKTKFLITHGHKRDHGIFYEAGRSRMQKTSTQTPSRVVTTKGPAALPGIPAGPRRPGSRSPRHTAEERWRPTAGTELQTCRLQNALGSIHRTRALWKTRALFPPSVPGFLHSAREQHSFRLAHFINKVKQHIKKFLHLLTVQVFH